MVVTRRGGGGVKVRGGVRGQANPCCVILE